MQCVPCEDRKSEGQRWDWNWEREIPGLSHSMIPYPHTLQQDLRHKWYSVTYHPVVQTSCYENTTLLREPRASAKQCSELSCLQNHTKWTAHRFYAASVFLWNQEQFQFCQCDWLGPLSGCFHSGSRKQLDTVHPCDWPSVGHGLLYTWMTKAWGDRLFSCLPTIQNQGFA